MLKGNMNNNKPLMTTMTFPSSRGFVKASRKVAKIANELEIRCSVDSVKTKVYKIEDLANSIF